MMAVKVYTYINVYFFFLPYNNNIVHYRLGVIYVFTFSVLIINYLGFEVQGIGILVLFYGSLPKTDIGRVVSQTDSFRLFIIVLRNNN